MLPEMLFRIQWDLYKYAKCLRLFYWNINKFKLPPTYSDVVNCKELQSLQSDRLTKSATTLRF